MHLSSAIHGGMGGGHPIALCMIDVAQNSSSGWINCRQNINPHIICHYSVNDGREECKSTNKRMEEASSEKLSPGNRFLLSFCCSVDENPLVMPFCRLQTD